MLKSVLGCHSFLPLFTFASVHPEMNVFYLQQHFLNVLLSPQLINLDFILPHQNFCYLFLCFGVFNMGLPKLVRKRLYFFYCRKSCQIFSASIVPNPLSPFFQLRIIVSVLLQKFLELGIIILYNLQFLFSEKVRNVLEVILNVLDQPEYLFLKILLPFSRLLELQVDLFQIGYQFQTQQLLTKGQQSLTLVTNHMRLAVRESTSQADGLTASQANMRRLIKVEGALPTKLANCRLIGLKRSDQTGS